MKQLRLPAVAGSFYPEDPNVLDKQLDSFLSKATVPEIKGEIKAIIVPHAGYIYSGQVAAYAYKAIEGGDYAVGVVIAPSHYTPFYGASIYKGDAYRIPSGDIPINQKLSRQITQIGGLIKHVPAAHLKEHALEVQLPFLKKVLPDFQLVPMVQGSQDFETCRKLAKAIVVGTAGEKVIIVASSDLSHYHSYREAVELDKIVQEHVKNFDPEGLAKAVGRGICEACGAGPMITAMLAARALGADKAEVLHYANSGDVSGMKSQVVGYMAVALYASGDAASKETFQEQEDTVDMGLTKADKKLLHQIARTTIEAGAKGESVPEFEIDSPVLMEKRGGFVTIKKRGHLRGCIGYIQAVKPLYQTVQEMARAAAFNDHRFAPVKEDELPELELEISVLTPLKPIKDISEIEVGKHGLYMQQGMRSGLLLPQVATEYNWDKLSFLRHTCQKAGLPDNAWQDKDTTIYIFSADIF